MRFMPLARGAWRLTGVASDPKARAVGSAWMGCTTQVGLGVWLKDANVFKCWESMWDVIWHGELGSSLAMLNAGALDRLGWWCVWW